MSQEILYTSAPKGLKPGSRGFCTVVSTSGMAKNLAERLESLSGYRHAFMPHDKNASLNPVNYVHAAVRVGGRELHILSRISDCGRDYTGRSNKLAHHIALEPHELPPGGPAAVMQDPDFFVCEWDGETRLLARGRVPRAVDVRPQVCLHWANVCGDAGWAGVLAEAGLNPARTMSVIFQAGTDTLALVAEAMSLLAPEQRWSVGFSTYFTKLPAGVDCQWRFVLDGTPEAARLRRDPHAQVIDLCAAGAKPPAGPYVDAARAGQAPRVKTAAAVPVARAFTREDDEPFNPRPPKGMPSLPGTPEPDLSELPARPQMPQDWEAEHASSQRPLAPTGPRRAMLPPLRRSRPAWQLPAVVGVSTFLIAILAGVIGFLVGQGGPPPDTDSPAVAQDSGAGQMTTSSQRATDHPPASEAAGRATKADSGPDYHGEEKRYQPGEDGRPRRNPVSAETAPAAETTAASETAPAAETAATSETAAAAEAAQQPVPAAAPLETARPPFEDIDARGGRLTLPPKSGPITGDPAANGKAELAKVYVPKGTALEVSFIGAEILKDSPTIKVIQGAEGKQLEWRIIKLATDSLGGTREQPAARLWLDGEALCFAWEAQRVVALEFGLLRLKVGDQERSCVLKQPLLVAPKKLLFSSRSPDNQPTEFGLPEIQLDQVRCEILPRNVSGLRLRPEGPLAPGGTARLEVLEPDGKKALFGIDIKFTAEGKLALTFAPTTLLKLPNGPLDKEEVKNADRSVAQDYLKRSKKIAEDTDRDIVKLKEEIAGFENRVKTAREELKKRRDRKFPKEAIEESEAAVERETELRDAKQREMNQASEKHGFYTAQASFCEQMLQAFQKFETESSIGYRLFLSLEGHEVDIVRTETTE